MGGGLSSQRRHSEWLPTDLSMLPGYEGSLGLSELGDQGTWVPTSHKVGAISAPTVQVQLLLEAARGVPGAPSLLHCTPHNVILSS